MADNTVAAVAELLARIFDDAPQPLWVVDDDGLIVLVNAAAVATLGYDDAAELLGRQSHQAVHYKLADGSPSPRSECSMRPPIEAGFPASGEDEWFVRRDGSLFPIAWWMAPIVLGQRHGTVLVFTDITERRAAEQALRAHNAAEIRAAESRAAQRRIAEGAAAVRRQIAQDLQDGAQRRLVSVLASLQRAGAETPQDTTRTLRSLDDAIDQTQRAIDELRELAASAYPPLLAYRGLVGAVEDLASRAALPVSVTGAVPRLPEVVEAGAYSFVAEALRRAAAHPGATGATVTLGLDGPALAIEVRDDGTNDGGTNDGGTMPATVADQVEGLGGRMALRSDPTGTTRSAVLPVGPPTG